MIGTAYEFSNKKCLPLFDGEQNNVIYAKMMPNLVVARGTVLGQVTSASADEVQKIDFSADGNVPTGGTFVVTIPQADGPVVHSTDDLAYNISAANLKIALDALLDAAGYTGGTVAITGSAAPADQTITFGGQLAGTAVPLMTATGTELTSSGTATVEITRTTAGTTKGLWGVYDASGTNDGRRTAGAIAMFDFRTDRTGRVIYTSVKGSNPPVPTYDDATPVYIAGHFKKADLTGLDATAEAALGRSVSDTIVSVV